MKMNLAMGCALGMIIMAGCMNLQPMSESVIIPGTIEGEHPARAAGKVKSRTNARREHTLLIKYGEMAEYTAIVGADGPYLLQIRYSNDDAGKCDDVVVMLDGSRVGMFHSQNTRKEGTKAGDGWNEFAESTEIKLGNLSAGEHTIGLLVDDGDAFGIEIDRLTIVQAESGSAK